MLHHHPLESPIFVAPIVPGETSLVQTYYRATRIMTVPLVAALGIGVAVCWMYAPFWWVVMLGIGAPISFLLGHLGLAKSFEKRDRRIAFQRNHLHIGKESITRFLPNGDIESIWLSDVSHLRVCYAGHEHAFFPRGKGFQPAANELSFQHEGKEIRLRFRIVSPGHHADFRYWLATWKAQHIRFEQYDSTSGYMLLLN